MRARNLVKKLVISAVVIMVCTMGVSVFGAELTIYSGGLRSLQDPLDTLVKKRLKVNVGSICMPGGTLWTKLQSEKPNIRADVTFGMSVNRAIVGKRQGLFLQHKSKAWESIPKAFGDPDGFYYMPYGWADILCANTKLMKKSGLKEPKSWNDLLDPKWKGKIVWPNPATSSGAYLFVAGMVRLMGEDKAFNYLEKLDKNISQYTKSGGAPSLFVGRGEATIGLSNTTSLGAHIREGYPLEPIVPKEGLPYTTTYIGIFKSAVNVKEAKMWVDLIASEEAQTLIGKHSAIIARPGVKNVFWGPRIDLIVIKDFDQEWVADNRARLLEKWKAKFVKR
jgi:iron(III) transport system substrate-binding protein